jgi:hypothetical protein
LSSRIEDAWLPPQIHNAKSEERHVGVEIEFAGIPSNIITGCVTESLGGRVVTLTSVEILIKDTSLGEFKLELDAAYLKKLVEEQSDDPDDNSIASSTVELITSAAEQLVPWEIVSPPIKLSDLYKLDTLIDNLRNAGAVGTRNAIHYAFGLHLNPELPDLNADTIVSYMRAYFCLYDWIVEQEQIDTTRKLTTYVKHFGKDYISLVLNEQYQPGLEKLIDDYLDYNPTRNRSLDLLPLFAHLDADRVKAKVDDPRIKSRPTFHYRLPNCDIDNPNWNLNFSWGLWLEVEKLANEPARLHQFCTEYSIQLERITHVIESRWAERVGELLADTK